MDTSLLFEEKITSDDNNKSKLLPMVKGNKQRLPVPMEGKGLLIEIPESVKGFPGLEKLRKNRVPICNKGKKIKNGDDKCGCHAFIESNSGVTVRNIRVEYIQSVQDDLSNGADWNHAPGAKNPAGSSYIKQFITPIPTQEKSSNPQTTRQTQLYTYNISIIINSSTLSFPRICSSTFEQIFGLTSRSLTKIRNDMMGKPTARTINNNNKKRGIINDQDVDEILSQLAQSEKYKSTVSILCGDDLKVREISYSHNEYDAWLELLTRLGDDEFIQESKTTGYYPTYTNKRVKTEQQPDDDTNKKPQQQQQLQPAVSYPTVYHFLRRANNNTRVKDAKQPQQQQQQQQQTPHPQQQQQQQQNQKATLLITGDGIYQRGLDFKRIPDVYGRCQQCKALREHVPNLYECTLFNIFTPKHFDDRNNNLKWIHGSLVNDDDDRHFDKDELTGRGGVCFKWLLDKLNNNNNNGIGELIFVGVGFTRNGEALQRLLFDVVERFPSLNITVVDIDPKREIKQHNYIRDKSLFYWNNINKGNTNKQVNFVCMDAERYLKELFMERTGFTSEQYNDLLQNKMSYPTTDVMNRMFAHWDDSKGLWIQNELRPHSDEWVKIHWGQLRKDNNYVDPVLFVSKRLSRSSTQQQ